MAGIWSGSLTLMCLSGLFCSTLGSIIPGIQPVMKYLGAAYILYLAWQTWRRLPPSDQVQEKMPTWKLGFFLQMINVKIIIYGLTMFSAYILPYESKVPVLFIFAVYLMILGGIWKPALGFCGKCAENIIWSALQNYEWDYGTASRSGVSEDCRCVVNKKGSVLSEREYRAFVFILTDFCFLLRTALIVPVLPLTSDTAPQY